MGVRDGDLLMLLDAERTDDTLTLTCSKAGEVVVIQGGLHGRYYGGLTFARYSTDPYNTGPAGMIEISTRNEQGHYGACSVFCADLEYARQKFQGVEVENELLPDLETFDLNPDGSVTLFLSSPRYGTALLSFNGAYHYRLTELRATLPVLEMVEGLTFCLVDNHGLAFHLKVRTPDALVKSVMIQQHFDGRTPKFEAATIGMSWSVAA